MHFSTVGIVALLCASAKAWEVTAYDNVANCDANDNTRYRIVSGASNNERCYTFDWDMPGTSCTEFQRGGASKGGCVSGSLLPRSVVFKGGACSAFNEVNCQGSKSSHTGEMNGRFGCSSLERYGWGPIRSFRCRGCKKEVSEASWEVFPHISDLNSLISSGSKKSIL
nr:uncharacterized protein CTRU02_14777 [Colletotrichum truncatum]KAF6781785.1 hypothetical protein CTRU02_14777 [Colletotrichum truncatum]